MATPVSGPTSARIFISYKRNIDPDQAVAARTFDVLRSETHEVFIDRSMTVGQLWAQEIERRVRSSDFLIVFLTAASIHSEMVKSEVEMARDEAARSGGRPRILPVRLCYEGPLPYPLNAWLDPIQYAVWREDSDTDKVLQELTAAIGGTELPLSAARPEPSPQRDGIPLHSAPLPPPGGGLDVDDPCYIRRDSDESASALIRQQGVTIVIKGARQMGKTSLLVRTLDTAVNLGKRCAFVDFQMLGHESLSSSTAFFRRFAASVTDQLELGHDAAQIWDPGLSDSQNFTRYIEKHVLLGLDTSFVLAVDEADMLFQAEFLYDFFGMLRSWHNARGNPLKKKLWKRVDLILVTSTEPYLFIERAHESPFNVGEVLPLSDFSLQQVNELNRLHAGPLRSSETDQLYGLLHGHPYLTRKALYVVKAGMRAEELFARAADDVGPFGDHLRNFFIRLLNYPDLAGALKQVALGRGCPDGRLAYRLQGAGLVKTEAGKVVPRCELYSRYFRERL